MAVATNFSFVHCYQETVRRHDNLEILSSCFLIMADNTELVEIRTSVPRAGRPPYDFGSICSSTDEGTCKPVVRKRCLQQVSDVHCRSRTRKVIAGKRTQWENREETPRPEKGPLLVSHQWKNLIGRWALQWKGRPGAEKCSWNPFLP